MAPHTPHALVAPRGIPGIPYRFVNAQFRSAQQLADEARDVGVQPRHTRELDSVRDLVQRHPRHELAFFGPESIHRLT